MTWTEQSPLNVLLSTVIGGLAADRKNKNALLDKEYERGQAMKALDIKQQEANAALAKANALGTYLGAKTDNAKKATALTQRKAGLDDNGNPTFTPVKIPVGDGHTPPQLTAVAAANRTNAQLALAAGATEQAKVYSNTADSIISQWSAAQAINARQREIDVRERGLTVQQAIAKEAHANALAIANITAAAHVAGSSAIAGGMTGSAKIRADAAAKEGAANRDFRNTQGNIAAAQRYDLSKYNQDRLDQRATASSVNYSRGEAQKLNQGIPANKQVAPYVPATPGEFAPQPLPVTPTPEEDAGNEGYLLNDIFGK